MENTVIKVLTKEHGKKVIEWFKLQGIDTNGYYGNVNEESGGTAIYYGVIDGGFSNFFIKNVIENNAKIIELPAEEEFDMSTDEGRLAYAKKHYPAGTRYISPEYPEKVFTVGNAIDGQQYWLGVNTYKNCVLASLGKHTGQFIYFLGKWAEIVKEEEKMETQKLSRAGLKEIHSVACSNWKAVLEKYGANSPLEDYIELTQEQVDNMFKACTKEQLPIVSKYLKQDDGSVNLTEYETDNEGFYKGNLYILRSRTIGKYKEQSFLLLKDYNWEIKTDEYGELCLIPTKKK